MECIDAVLPEQLLRPSDVNCLVSNGYGETYKDYLCLLQISASHFNRHIKSWKDRVQHIHSKCVYTLQDTLFDKLNGFGIFYNDDRKLFENLAIFDFKSICVPTEEIKRYNYKYLD